jgi:hypothetical protein
MDTGNSSKEKYYRVSFEYACDEGHTAGSLTISAGSREAAVEKFNEEVAPALAKAAGHKPGDIAVSACKEEQETR